jgi:hypothetical protein
MDRSNAPISMLSAGINLCSALTSVDPEDIVEMESVTVLMDGVEMTARLNNDNISI